MKSIQQEYIINVPAPAVWKALIDPKVINSWGGGPAKMSDLENFSFSLWGGDIYGKNIKVIKEKELMQEWFSKGWQEPSIVVFLLEEKNGITIVTLYQKNIPDKEVQSIDEGWKEYYMGPLKNLLEKK